MLIQIKASDYNEFQRLYLTRTALGDIRIEKCGQQGAGEFLGLSWIKMVPPASAPQQQD